MKKHSLIGSNSANSKFSIEVKGGILAIGEGKMEFTILGNREAKLIVNFGSDEIYKVFEDYIKKDPYAIQRPSRKVDETVGRFLSEMNYQRSEVEYVEATSLFEGYMGYCSEHKLMYANFIDFIGSLESLGFKTNLCPRRLAVLVYCKKEE